MIIVVVLNLFILFYMKSEIKHNQLTPKKFDIQYGDLIMKLLVNILLYTCILRLFLFTLLNFKI